MKDAYWRPEEPSDRPTFWKPSLTFLNYAIACLLAGCVAFTLAIFVFAPDQAARAVGPLSFSLTAVIAWFLLSRGRIKAAVLAMGLGMWVVVTVLSTFFGGVRSTSVILYPVIILMVGWLVGERAVIAMAVLTVATTLGFAVADAWGILPVSAPAPAALYWVVQCGAFTVSALLIVFLARSFQKRLKEANQLRGELALRITEIESAGEALRTSEIQLQSILGATADGILAVDRLGKVLRINRRFAQLWQIPEALLERKDDQVLLDYVLQQLEDPTAFVDKVQALYQSDFQATDTLKFKDGRVFERFTSPLVSDGAMLGRIWSFRDITERELAQRTLANMNVELDQRVRSHTADLERANQALQRSNMELQRFAYVASHDLRTPLRAIGSFAQLLQRSIGGRLDAQSEDWMRRIVANAQRLDGMLQDMHSYTQIDARAQPFQRVDLAEACQAALGWLRDSVQSSRAQITCGPLPMVLGDAQQLKQVFQNLIGNAIMYYGEGAPKIEISARSEDGHHVISVSDRGVGIEAAHQQRIFDMFYRLHLRPDYPGTGIGLAVCQRIVHRHRGRIWVESEPGKGSTFLFTIPAAGEKR